MDLCLLCNTLSGFVIAFLPRSKHLLISWLQSPSAVILEPKKIKFVTISIVSPSICHEVMGLDAMILVFVGLHQFSCSVMSDSVRPHGWTAALQASLFFTISQSLLKLMSIESVMPTNHLFLFSTCLQSFPTSGSFPVSQLLPSGGQSIGASASASILPMNIQD